MDAKEVIKTIEIAIAEVEWCYPMEYAIAFEEANKALEKQIPKKPVRKTMYDNWRWCPVCGKQLSIGYMKWCSDCGQALDWSVNEPLSQEELSEIFNENFTRG